MFTTRRSMLAGLALPAVVTGCNALPAFAATSEKENPDAALLALDAQYRKACEAEGRTRKAYGIARDACAVVLVTRPDALMPLLWEWRSITSITNRKAWGHINFRWCPPVDPDDCWASTSIWTGLALRQAISRAVPALGRGGITPSLIRRWKTLLPIADAFDARIEAVEGRTGYRMLSQAKDDAEKKSAVLCAAVTACVATTPEGLAALVRVGGEYSWEKAGGVWPNLLRSAANIAGVELKSRSAE